MSFFSENALFSAKDSSTLVPYKANISTPHNFHSIKSTTSKRMIYSWSSRFLLCHDSFYVKNVFIAKFFCWLRCRHNEFCYSPQPLVARNEKAKSLISRDSSNNTNDSFARNFLLLLVNWIQIGCWTYSETGCVEEPEMIMMEWLDVYLVKVQKPYTEKEKSRLVQNNKHIKNHNGSNALCSCFLSLFFSGGK